MNRKKKAIDCLQLKQDIQDKIIAETQRFTQDQELEYFRRMPKDAHLSEWWNSVKNQKPSKKKAA